MNEDQILNFLKAGPIEHIKDIQLFFKEIENFESIIPIGDKDKEIPREGKINKSPFSKQK